MPNENAKNPEFFVDNDPYQWTKPTITGAEIRAAAAVPDGVTVFLKIPGQSDKEIQVDMTVDLNVRPGPERFSTQAVGSQAG